METTMYVIICIYYIYLECGNSKTRDLLDIILEVLCILVIGIIPKYD